MLVFLFLFSLFLYLTTCAPDIYWLDSGKFVLSSFFLIKYHLPINSLYAISGKIFTFLPIENIPFKINFLSAFISSLTPVFFYLLIFEFLKDIDESSKKIISFFSSLFFLSSFTLWRFAVIADRNSLVFFIYTFTLLLLYKFINSKDIRIFYLSVFIIGFLTSGLIDFYIPFFGVSLTYSFFNGINKGKRMRHLFNAILIYHFCLLFFGIFNVLIIKNIISPFGNFNIFFYGSYFLKHQMEMFNLSALGILNQCLSLIYYLNKQIGMYLGVIAILGLFYIYKFHKTQLKSLIIIFLTPFFLGLIWNPLEDIFSWEDHYFTVYFLLFIFFAYTILFGLRIINFRFCIFIFTSIFLIHINCNFQLNNKSSLKLCREEISKILNIVENNSVIFTQNLEIKQLINYFQLMENKREDIFVLGTVNFSNPMLLQALRFNKPYFQDEFPTIGTPKRVAENIDKIIEISKKRPIYLLVSERYTEPEESILYNKFLKYNKKFITKIVQFKGEKIPSPYVNSLFKVLIDEK